MLLYGVLLYGVLLYGCVAAWLCCCMVVLLHGCAITQQRPLVFHPNSSCFPPLCPSNMMNTTQAIEALLGGANVVVCTSTASGKSVCYSEPILEALVADAEVCALLMFPTKALAQVW